jgi:hypothetical protein
MKSKIDYLAEIRSSDGNKVSGDKAMALLMTEINNQPQCVGTAFL